METNDLIQQISDEGASRPLMHPLQQSMFWVMAIITYLFVFLLFDGFRPDLSEKLGSSEFLFELGLLFAVGMAATFATFCLTRPDDFQIAWAKYMPLGILAIWAIFAFISAGDNLQLTNLIDSVALVQVHCPIHIIGFSAIPAVVIFILVRMGAVIRIYWAGIMSALSVTAFAYLFMRLVENNDNPAHLIVWHAIPILVLCLLGMYAGKKTLRW